MHQKPFSVLRHAVQMVGRNIRSYARLSVTIILSLSVLLGFMGYMDTEHYNTLYKGPFSRDRNILAFDTMTLSPSRITQIQEKAETVGTTHSMQNFWIHINIDTKGWMLSSGESFSGEIQGTAYCLPRECWFLQERIFGNNILDPTKPFWLDSREDLNISLKKGQILMDEQLYKALSLNTKNNEVDLSFYYGTNMDKYTGKFNVVGTIPSTAALEIEIEENKATGEKSANIKGIDYMTALVFSLDDLNPTDNLSSSWHRQVFFYSDQPENVKNTIKSFEPNIGIYTVFEAQDNALETMRTEKATKALVAALLLLILGINLYSSFENALNDRKFEIGVKRAMGASGFSIIRQFFYESMLVMIANIAISVVLVVDLGILLKLYREVTYRAEISENSFVTTSAYMDYILYITPYSIGIFAACAVVLTVVFSFVFAYKTTQVQIVDYLKAE